MTYGTRAQNQPMIEGMLMSQIGSAGGSVTFYYDYGSFQQASSVIPPRIVRFGAKFDW